MDLATPVQILDEVVYILDKSNTLEKCMMGMNQFSPSAMSK